MSSEADSERVRCFIALDLPEALSGRISAWQREQAGDVALRPVSQANMHITLAFLGSVEGERLTEVEAVVAALKPRVVELDLDREPVAVPARRPRLIALGCSSVAAVALQAELSAALAKAGLYRPERRPFWPHLTVFRLRSGGAGSDRAARLARPLTPLPPGAGRGGAHTFGSVRVALYRSDLRPEGAKYSRLAATELPQASGQAE